MTQPKTRLYVDARLAAGADVALSRDQAHYLANVMRLKAGSGVALFNGRDGEWSAALTAVNRNGCTAACGERTRAQADEDGPWLVFAPVKKAGTDFLVEKATELGAVRLSPVFTRNTNTARINVDRLKAHAVEAAELSGRLSLPEIDAPRPLADALDRWPADRRLLVLDEHGSGAPIAEVLAGLAAPCGILSGPEGGFAADEMETLRRLEFVTTVGLGPRILRAETAALAALACWRAILGDRSRPGSGG